MGMRTEPGMLAAAAPKARGRREGVVGGAFELLREGVDRRFRGQAWQQDNQRRGKGRTLLGVSLRR